MENSLMHTQAVNLARRYSVQNEHDLLQEDFMSHPEPRRKLDHDGCQELSSHLIHFNALPNECKKFLDVVTNLKRRETTASTSKAEWTS